MASSWPYHKEHSQSVATSVGHPPHSLPEAALIQTSSFNNMQNGCLHDAPPSSEEPVQMRGFKPAQNSPPQPAARFELYQSNQSELSNPSLLHDRLEDVSMRKKGVPPTPLLPPTHPAPPQMCDVGTGTDSPPVAERGTLPLLGQLAASSVSVTTQTACNVGTQTVSSGGEETTNQPDLATCPMPQPSSPFPQPTHSATPLALARPLMSQGDSSHSRISQPVGAPPPHQHAFCEPANKPPSLHTSVNQPPSLHMEESQQWGTLLATALETAQSSLAANEQPNMEAPNGRCVCTLIGAGEAVQCLECVCLCVRTHSHLHGWLSSCNWVAIYGVQEWFGMSDIAQSILCSRHQLILVPELKWSHEL